ncbi:TIGR02646 family protein [Pseudomonas sp. NFACC02]|uniref:HNH endonuclease n=1 Tax=Pseudomonas sp. NFACC02 TaxID=1566250 RepID=UPI0008B695C0|nr:HNH endonuclease [Pseudomonas sp. NFACC02]SEQ55808.1 TIGR02646 family protein [Pseudomonas sp. NFACC02]
MQPVVFAGADLAYVVRYDGISHQEWNRTDGPVAELRRTVRVHYLRQQGYRCAYCRMEKKENHGLTWDVEHIIPKSVYPRFLYEPLNLAMVCKECNIAKLDQDVLHRRVGPGAVFPSRSEDYKIVHPHFDRYSDHFEMIVVGGRISHRPRNPLKAKETFLMCNLVRFSYAFGEWEDFNYEVVKRFSEFVESCPPDATRQQITSFMQTLRFTVNGDF